MKSHKLLLALCSVALLAAPAYASSSLPFHGSLYQASGAAVVARGSTGALAISNIGSSGNDGVSFDCSHMDGMSLSLAGQTGPSDAGLSQTFTYSWTLVSRPQGSHASLSSARTSDGWDLNCDLSSFASPASVHAKLYLAGQLVADKVGTYQLSVVARDASGALYNPKEYAFLSRATSSVHAGLHFPVTVRVQLADGTTQDCDDVDFVCALSETDKDCDGASCDLRLTSPPASPPRSLDCVDATCRTHEGSVEYDIAGIGNSRVKVRFPWLSGADRLGRPAINTALFSGDDGFVISSNPLYSDPGLGGSNPLAKGGSSGPVRFVTSPSGLAFDLARDQGAGVTLTIQGDNFSASHTRTYTAGHFALDIDGGQLRMQHSATLYPTAPESAAVLSHGVEVARYRLQSGFVYVVQASAPGVGAKLVEVASAGLKASWNVKANVKAAPAHAGRTSAESPMVLTPQLMPRLRLGACPMSCAFTAPLQFTLDGQTCVGDEIVAWTGVPDDGSTTQMSSLQVHLRPSSGSITQLDGALTDIQMLSSGIRENDNVVFDVQEGKKLSTAHTCITVPCVFDRTNVTGMRGYSVKFHVSQELATCSSASIVEGDYLSRVASTQFFVTDNGGGSYTVDCSILGPVCGATGSGALFSVDLSATQPVSNPYGVITVDDVVVRDCSNHPVPAVAGGDALIGIDFTAPAAVASLTAVQSKFNNGPRQTTSIVLAAAVTDPEVDLHFFTKGFGNYPSYVHGQSPGSVPSVPATSAAALASGWEPVALSCNSAAGSSCVAGSGYYFPNRRDFFYFVVYATDPAGNESRVSNMTPGTLSYHLGDVSDGVAACSGDNRVTLADVSLLGAYYGLSAPAGSPRACLDVAPTSDFSVDALPTTDGKVNFEELMVFSINYSVVSAPALRSRPAPLAANASRVSVPALPAVGGTFELPVQFDGAGDALGVSVKLDFDHNVLEQLGVAAGALLDQQDRAGTVLSSEPGDIDAALLGTGSGISGSGELARVTFRVKALGDPAVSIRTVTARDAQNHPVGIAGVDGSGLAATTGLGFSYPNPFTAATAIRMSLRRDADVKLAVFDIAGRRVRLLLSGLQPAGARTVTWDGRDDGGVRMAPGAYVVRMDSAGHHESRTVRLVR